jgi:hypothetical protein
MIKSKADFWAGGGDTYTDGQQAIGDVTSQRCVVVGVSLIYEGTTTGWVCGETALPINSKSDKIYAV